MIRLVRCISCSRRLWQRGERREPWCQACAAELERRMGVLIDATGWPLYLARWEAGRSMLLDAVRRYTA